jgi:hypothetical protein
VFSIASRCTLTLLLAMTLASDGSSQTQVIAPHILNVEEGSSSTASLTTPRNVGDLDNDGVDDQAYGSALHDGSGTDAGYVVVRSGSDGSTLWSASGNSAGDLFGWSLASIGDLDDDGVAEIAIGAPGLINGSSAGRVTIHSGTDGSVLHTFTGSSAGDCFGYALDGAGDYDLDGDDDILVGAPFEDANGTDSGAAYIFSGGDFSLLESVSGSAAGDLLGAAVKGLPPRGAWSGHDPGLIIGAPNGGSSDQGIVEFRDGTDFTTVNSSVSGTATNDRFGISLAIPGDLDEDTFLDVLIGADPVDSSGSSTGISYVRVISGDDGSTLWTVNGPTGAAFGRAVSGIGDMDGDAIPDWAVGAPLDNANGTDAGALFVYSGTDASLLHVMRGTAGSEFGSAICHAGDIDDDGLEDLLVSAPLDDSAGTDQGVILTVSFTRFDTVGDGVPGVNGVPEIHSQGTLQPLSNLTLVLTEGRASASAVLIMGHSLIFDSTHQIFVPLPDTSTSGYSTDSVGRLEVSDTWPAGFAAGTLVYWQIHVADTAASNDVAISQLISGVTP